MKTPFLIAFYAIIAFITVYSQDSGTFNNFKFHSYIILFHCFIFANLKNCPTVCAAVERDL